MYREQGYLRIVEVVPRFDGATDTINEYLDCFYDVADCLCVHEIGIVSEHAAYAAELIRKSQYFINVITMIASLDCPYIVSHPLIECFYKRAVFGYHLIESAVQFVEKVFSRIEVSIVLHGCRASKWWVGAISFIAIREWDEVSSQIWL